MSQTLEVLGFQTGWEPLPLPDGQFQYYLTLSEPPSVRWAVSFVRSVKSGPFALAADAVSVRCRPTELEFVVDMVKDHVERTNRRVGAEEKAEAEAVARLVQQADERLAQVRAAQERQRRGQRMAAAF